MNRISFVPCLAFVAGVASCSNATGSQATLNGNVPTTKVFIRME